MVLFLLHCILFAMHEAGWLPFRMPESLFGHPLHILYTPFSAILVAEVYLLVFHLPSSFARSMGKQLEIVSLIEIRSVFRDLSALQEGGAGQATMPWQDPFFPHIVGAVMLGAALVAFYRILPRRKARMEEVDFNSPEFRQASVPAANGMFTARSLARMYACLAHGGELDGVRLLPEAQILRATQIQNRTIGRVMPIPMHWRLGYHRVFTVRAKAPAAFGHFGFGGSGAWADPERDLSAALTVNSGVGTPFGDSRIARVSGAVMRSADRR